MDCGSKNRSAGQSNLCNFGIHSIPAKVLTGEDIMYFKVIYKGVEIVSLYLDDEEDIKVVMD